jgi:hypothetical protein
MIAGTLACLAPAQTGRMKRSIAVGLGGKSDKKSAARKFGATRRVSSRTETITLARQPVMKIASGGSPE